MPLTSTRVVPSCVGSGTALAYNGRAGGELLAEQRDDGAGRHVVARESRPGSRPHPGRGHGRAGSRDIEGHRHIDVLFAALLATASVVV